MDAAQIQKEINQTFETFKGYVDREFAEVKKNGVVSPETKEALQKMNDRFDALQKRMDEIASKAGRPDGRSEEEREKSEVKAALNSFLRKGWDRMTAEQQAKAMSVGSNPDGGWFVDTAEGPMAKKLYDTTPMRQVASVISISTADVEGLVDNDEAAYGWVSETAARTETTTPTHDKYKIATHEMYAEPRVTQKLLDDASFNIESWLNGKVADRFARGQNDAFINGDGIVKPRGIATYTTAATADSTRAWGTLEHVVSGASADFAATTPADKIFDLIYALKAGYRAGASFMMPKAVLGKIRKFKEATTNAYMWQPGLQAGEPQRLLGYPIVESEDMPALAASSLSMAFGNFKEGYLIVDRAGIRILRDPYTAKPYIKFYTTARVGGGIVNSECVKFMKFTT